MKKLFLMILLGIVLQSVYGQQTAQKGWFSGFSAELPTYRLSGIELPSQQLSFESGYSFSQQSSLFISAGIGLTGLRLISDTPLSLSHKFTFGLGGDYLPIAINSYKLGIEARVGLNTTNFKLLKNATPLFYQAGIKGEVKHLYTVLGIRQHQFLDTQSHSSTEIFLTVGYRIPW